MKTLFSINSTDLAFLVILLLASLILYNSKAINLFIIKKLNTNDKATEKLTVDVLKVGIVFISIALLLPLFIIISTTFNLEGLHNVGDAIGGIMNPFIAIASVLTTGLAFYAQYNANKKIQDQFEIQQFSTHFYELLKIHNENVKAMEIDNKIFGKKCFSRMWNELEFIARVYYQMKWPKIESISELQKIKNSNEFIYHYFFYGIGPHSNKIIKNSDSISLEHLSEFPETLKFVQELYFQHQDKNEELLNIALKEKLKNERSKFNTNHINADICLSVLNKMSFNIYYTPFYGHSSRLSHYYRHLFMLVRFVIDSKINGLNKMEYIKTIRAQLSTHEQLLLYFNSFAYFGEGWNKHMIFSKYRFIKNASFELVDFVNDPLAYFKLLVKEVENYGFYIKTNEDKKEILINENEEEIFDFSK